MEPSDPHEGEAEMTSARTFGLNAGACRVGYLAIGGIMVADDKTIVPRESTAAQYQDGT